MNSRLLNLSICLNLLLLGVAGYWVVRNVGNTSSTTNPIAQTNQTGKTEFAPTEFAIETTPLPLRWNEIESKDYPTYVANLRNAGCPEPVLRRIIAAELNELYARKAFALAEKFHRDFWTIAARENIRANFEKTFGQQVKALGKESEALLKQLVGDAPRELPGAANDGAPDSRLTNFLSPEKQEQVKRISARYEARLQAIRESNLSPEEKATRLAQLQRKMENEQAGILSPEEFAEYQLRQSSAATELQQLYGVDFSETELRNLVKAIDDYHRLADSQNQTASETLEQKLQAVLGPDRFADYNRARSASYREIYEVVSDFGLPGETASEVFDLRLASEEQSEAIRTDRNRSASEKQALLDGLQEQIEQAVLTRFGAAAYQNYKAKEGRWINSLGRL